MKWLAIKAINFYQKFISPYKGFNCTHRVATGETSCSGYGKKVIQRFGLMVGLKLLNRRFYDCSWHSKQLKKLLETQNKNQGQYKVYRPVSGYKLNQGGFVDCDCPSDCDLPSCDIPSCEAPSCDIPSCDMPIMGDCLPDFGSGLNRACFFLNIVDCMPNDCCVGNAKRTPQFQEKRDTRNEGMYFKPQEHETENLKKEDTDTEKEKEKEISLKKSKDIGEVDSPE